MEEFLNSYEINEQEKHFLSLVKERKYVELNRLIHIDLNEFKELDNDYLYNFVMRTFFYYCFINNYYFTMNYFLSNVEECEALFSEYKKIYLRVNNILDIHNKPYYASNHLVGAITCLIAISLNEHSANGKAKRETTILLFITLCNILKNNKFHYEIIIVDEIDDEFQPFCKHNLIPIKIDSGIYYITCGAIYILYIFASMYNLSLFEQINDMEMIDIVESSISKIIQDMSVTISPNNNPEEPTYSKTKALLYSLLQSSVMLNFKQKIFHEPGEIEMIKKDHTKIIEWVIKEMKIIDLRNVLDIIQDTKNNEEYIKFVENHIIVSNV